MRKQYNVPVTYEKHGKTVTKTIIVYTTNASAAKRRARDRARSNGWRVISVGTPYTVRD